MIIKGMVRHYRWIFWCGRCKKQCDFHSTSERDRTTFAKHMGYRYNKHLRRWMCAQCSKGAPE